ncbi:MAG: TolC family protein [Acidiferrobacterales bacterium]
MLTRKKGLNWPKKLLLISLAVPFTANWAGDPVSFAGQDKITATQLTIAVLQRNKSLSAMTAAWQAARARIASARAFEDPILSYTLAPDTQNLAGQDLGQKIILSQKLPWPGKRGLQGEQAEQRANARKERITLTSLALQEESHRLYAEWFYIHEAIRINLVNRELWDEFRIIAELKYSTGQASRQDALQAAVEQVTLEHHAIVLQRRQHHIRARINHLLNHSPERRVPSPAGIEGPRALPDASVLRGRAMSSHPSILTLRAELQAQQAQTRLAKRNYFPDFKVSVGYNSLWAQQEKRNTIGVGLNLPLAWSKRKGDVDESKALARQLQWKLQDKLMEVASKTQQAYDSIEESHHAITLYRNKLVPLAEESLQAARSEYQFGKGDFLRLVSAEKSLMQTQLSWIRTQSEYHHRLAVLASRVGDSRIMTGELAGKTDVEGVAR